MRDLSANVWGIDLTPPVEDAKEEDLGKEYAGADVAMVMRMPLVREGQET
jgi:hypothetical protein